MISCLSFVSVLEWELSDVQEFANISNSTIIAIEWGFRGLSCYGYVQISLCLIDKIVDFIAFLLIRCVEIETLELIGKLHIRPPFLRF